MGKLQTRQAVLRGKDCGLGQGDPGTCGEDRLSLQLQAGQASGDLHHEGLHPLVSHQQVGALPQKEGGYPRLPGGFQKDGQLLLAPGQGHEGGGTSDFKGGVAGHGFPLPQFQAGQGPAQLFSQRSEAIHEIPPSRFGFVYCIYYIKSHHKKVAFL